jgi:hypothetical protein
MTVNQRNFARLAAQGMNLTDAHAGAYGKTKGKRRNQSVEASRLAKRPDVQAAIEEFEKQIAPIGDLRVARQRMLANIQYLACFSPDQKVRLAASIDLRNYVDECEARERKLLDRAPVNVETLLGELAELRERRQPRTIELEAVLSDQADAVPAGWEPDADA